MARFVVGNPVTIEVVLTDDEGAPVTNAADGDFTESIDHEAANGTLTAATVGTWTHRGSGRYRATIASGAEGRYVGTVRHTPDPAQVWEWEAEVVTAAQADPLGASLSGALPNTARAALARLMTVSSPQIPLTRTTGLNLTIRRGDRFVYPFLLLEQDGSDLDLTGKTVWMTVKPAVPAGPTDDLDDASAVSGLKFWWQHDGGEVVSSNRFASADPPSGIITLTLPPSLTTTLALAKGLPFDIQVMASADDVWTAVEGTVTVTPDLTRRTTVP